LVHLQLQAAKIDNKNKRKGFFNISTVYHWNGAHHVW
jgi:acyl-CoA-binding protein